VFQSSTHPEDCRCYLCEDADELEDAVPLYREILEQAQADPIRTEVVL
jgi:hypothetical protein